MKLYYCPPAASIAPLIAAYELDLDVSLESVDLITKQTSSGIDLFTVNPKGLIPVMELNNGETMTETSAMLLYIAGLNPCSRLGADERTSDYYRIVEWLSYFSSEIHKLYTMLFWDVDLDTKREVSSRILKKFDYIETELAEKDYLVANRYTIADIYLYAMIRGLHLIKVDTKRYPRVFAFKNRIEERSTVQTAVKRHEFF